MYVQRNQNKVMLTSPTRHMQSASFAQEEMQLRVWLKDHVLANRLSAMY